MSHHSFDISIAEKYGVNNAIFLNNMDYWIRKNQSNNRHFHDGRFWTYNTMEAFTKLFPYWTFKQIRTVIKNLKSNGLIMKAKYNKAGYDQTSWYALTNLGHQVLGIPICPNGQMELTKKANGIDQKGKPIPNTNSDIKTDNRRERERKKKSRSLSFNDFKTEEALKLCKDKNLDIEKEYKKYTNHFNNENISIGKFLNWLERAKPEKRINTTEASNTAINIEDYVKNYIRSTPGASEEEARNYYRNRGYAC